MIKFLLLFVLSFNIAHATIIAVLDDCDDCHNNTLYAYLHEIDVVADTADLCTMHHCFHFVAIIATSNIHFDTYIYSKKLQEKITSYSPPSKELSTKPPIA